MDSCGDTLLKNYKLSKGERVKFTKSFLIKPDSIYSIFDVMYNEISTVDGFVNDHELDIFNKELTDLDIKAFVKMLFSLLKREKTLGVIIDPYGEESFHLFLLKYKDGNSYIIDSYICEREESERIFDFKIFRKYLKTGKPKYFEKLFMSSEYEDRKPTRGVVLTIFG
jgi:hypothetical protein